MHLHAGLPVLPVAVPQAPDIRMTVDVEARSRIFLVGFSSWCAVTPNAVLVQSLLTLSFQCPDAAYMASAALWQAIQL